jgi:hypothetical protein
MMWGRLRDYSLAQRGYRGFNTLDRIAIAAMGLGAVVFLGGVLFDADGIAGPGLFLLIIGFLTLIRAFPGDGG